MCLCPATENKHINVFIKKKNKHIFVCVWKTQTSHQKVLKSCVLKCFNIEETFFKNILKHFKKNILDT